MGELTTDFLRLAAALAAGGVIGLERESHDKPAGFRTNILICVGAALFALVSERAAAAAGGDPHRIAAQIVTGVGFLGAGAIIQHRGAVSGLTTAATIWGVASIGTAFGCGRFALGILGTVLTAGTLFGLGVVETRLAGFWTRATFELELEPAADAVSTIEALVDTSGARRIASSVSKTLHGLGLVMTVAGTAQQLAQLHDRMLALPTVRGLRRR